MVDPVDRPRTTPEPPPDEAFRLLVLRVLDGAAEEREIAELDAALAANAGLRDLFVSLCHQHAMLRELHLPATAGEEPVDPSGETSFIRWAYDELAASGSAQAAEPDTCRVRTGWSSKAHPTARQLHARSEKVRAVPQPVSRWQAWKVPALGTAAAVLVGVAIFLLAGRDTKPPAGEPPAPDVAEAPGTPVVPKPRKVIVAPRPEKTEGPRAETPAPDVVPDRTKPDAAPVQTPPEAPAETPEPEAPAVARSETDAPDVVDPEMEPDETIVPAVVWPLPSEDRETVPVVALLERAEGRVEILATRTGKTTEGRNNQFLLSGNGLAAVGRKSRASVLFRDGTRLDVEGNARIAWIAEAGLPPPPSFRGRPVFQTRGKQIYVERGAVTVQVTHQSSRSPTLVVTPHAEAQALGTLFVTTVTDRATRLETMEGRVLFGTPQGSVVVPAHHASTAAANAAPAEPTEILVAVAPAGPQDLIRNEKYWKTGAKAEFRTVPDRERGGRVLRVEFTEASRTRTHICNHDTAEPEDWSGWDGVQFWFYGNQTGMTAFLDLHDNPAPGKKSSWERYWYTIVDDFKGWRQFRVPWSAFSRRTDFQPKGAPNDGLTLTKVQGLGVNFRQFRKGDWCLIGPFTLFKKRP